MSRWSVHGRCVNVFCEVKLVNIDISIAEAEVCNFFLSQADRRR